MKQEAQRERARQMAEMILKVRAGVLNASQAAQALGISRKTYYTWEKRGLSGMLEGLCERNSGRPGSPYDGEKKALQQTITELEKYRKRKEQEEEIRKLLKVEGEKKG